VCEAKLLNVLSPHLAALRIEGLSNEEGVVCLRARADTKEAPCPACGVASGRVHSWYERRMADAPVAGQPVLIHLRVRRFICQTLDCARQIFCEQLAGLTARHGRRSLQLVELLVAIAFALAGRAGARLARQAAISCDRRRAPGYALSGPALTRRDRLGRSQVGVGLGVQIVAVAGRIVRVDRPTATGRGAKGES
jgi:hypothetical protein